MKNKKYDKSLLFIIGALLLFGIITLYSASAVESFEKFGNSYHYILRQFLYGGILGIAALIICSKINYHFWQRKLPWLILLSLLFLALVKVPSLSISAGGATRWLDLGPISFQPSELAKITLILYLASWADRKKSLLNNFYFGILPTLIIIITFSALIIWQPDYGTMAVLISTALAMLFAGGMNIKYFFWTVVSGIGMLIALIKLEPYRLKRFTAFMNPEMDPKGIAYHINQALLAIGSGGIFGYGYGLSRQKHNYLPEVMGDSIFAIIGEELGFIGVCILLTLFSIFALKGYKIAKNAADNFGKMTAFGITSLIVIQAIINIGAMARLLPLTGIPLPFFSYGSTSLLVMLASCGILLNISKSSKS